MRFPRTATVLAVASLGAVAPAWAGGWAAMADNAHGHWGYAVGKSTGAAAANAAISGCNAPDCKVGAIRQVPCIAYAVGPQRTKGFGMGFDSATAVHNAIGVCEAGPSGADCHVVKAVCE